jgi:hypothetical protein
MGKAGFFLTCDDKITRKAGCIETLALEKGYKLKVSNPVNYVKMLGKMKNDRIAGATVEVPFEALVRELGAKRAIEFVSEIRRCYGDSVVELRKATEKLTIEQVEAEYKTLKKKSNPKGLSAQKSKICKTHAIFCNFRLIF